MSSCFFNIETILLQSSQKDSSLCVHVNNRLAQYHQRVSNKK